MRFIAFILFLAFLAIFVLAVYIDVTIGLEEDGWVFQPFGEMFQFLGLLGLLGQLQAGIERNISPDIWWNIVNPILESPAMIVTFFLAAGFGWLFYSLHNAHKARQVELVSSSY